MSVIVCEGCGKTFYHKKQGKPKYCLDCGVIVYEEHHKKWRERHAELIGKY